VCLVPSRAPARPRACAPARLRALAPKRPRALAPKRSLHMSSRAPSHPRDPAPSCHQTTAPLRPRASVPACPRALAPACLRTLAPTRSRDCAPASAPHPLALEPLFLRARAPACLQPCQRARPTGASRRRLRALAPSRTGARHCPRSPARLRACPPARRPHLRRPPSQDETIFMSDSTHAAARYTEDLICSVCLELPEIKVNQVTSRAAAAAYTTNTARPHLTRTNPTRTLTLPPAG